MSLNAARTMQSQYLYLTLNGYQGGLNWLDVLKLAVKAAHHECDSPDLCGLLADLQSRLANEPEVLNTARAVSATLEESVDIHSVLAAVEAMYPDRNQLSWRMTVPPLVECLLDERKVAVTVTIQHNKSVAEALAESILRYAVDSAAQRAG